ncbi:hypothetical protein [Cryobacterium sp. N21]|nr:hypothetical protein [Cryobacterium sp. N21]
MTTPADDANSSSTRHILPSWNDSALSGALSLERESMSLTIGQ